MIDHLVLGAADLDEGIEHVEGLLGVRPAAGGKHPGGGTHNALLSLGDMRYLEILAPDPEQEGLRGALTAALRDLDRPRLVTWAAKAADIDERVAAAQAAGPNIGVVSGSSRQLPDGSLLEWSFTFPPPAAGGGVAPFLIRWGPGSHPSETAPSGCELLAFRGEHPEPEPVRALLSAMAVELPVTEGPAPALIATIRCPRGIVELR